MGLFDEVVPVLLLLVKELGFLLASSDKGLKKDNGQNTKIHEEKGGREARLSEYPASGNDDFTQGAPSMVQGFLAAAIPSSRLSCSMLSVASSRAKSVDVGSCGFIHRSRGSPCVGEWLPLDVMARDDSPLVHSTTAATFGDPSAMSPSVRPTSTVVTWAADGADRVASSSSATATFGYAWLVIVTATSACVGGASTDGVTPTAVGATSVSGSSIRFDVGSRIASVVGCSVISEGTPSSSVLTCPTEGTGATASGTSPASDAVALAPLPPEMGATSADGRCVA